MLASLKYPPRAQFVFLYGAVPLLGKVMTLILMDREQSMVCGPRPSMCLPPSEPRGTCGYFQNRQPNKTSKVKRTKPRFGFATLLMDRVNRGFFSHVAPVGSALDPLFVFCGRQMRLLVLTMTLHFQASSEVKRGLGSMGLLSTQLTQLAVWLTFMWQVALQS